LIKLSKTTPISLFPIDIDYSGSKKDCQINEIFHIGYAKAHSFVGRSRAHSPLAGGLVSGGRLAGYDHE
jgi:hypothetical protein